MVLARGLAVAIVVALGISVVPGSDWAFQFVYPLILALGAASIRWWPIAIVLLLPVWAAVDYSITPYEDTDWPSNPGTAALFALILAVPLAAAAFAVGKGLRAFALALGARNTPSP